MKGEEQEAIVGILEEREVRMASRGTTPLTKLAVANLILDAGFHRTLPRKVSKGQLWTYAIETTLLAMCASMVFGHGLPFVYGALCALMVASAATFGGALVINHNIKNGARK
jgi:hypothetical protein